MPFWRSLLEVYSALAIPVVFSVLLGLNMVAWARKRLNYVFIFELDLRTVIDPREYFEVRVLRIGCSLLDLTFSSLFIDSEFSFHDTQLCIHALIFKNIRTSHLIHDMADRLDSALWCCDAGSFSVHAQTLSLLALEKLVEAHITRSLPRRGMNAETLDAEDSLITLPHKVCGFLDGRSIVLNGLSSFKVIFHWMRLLRRLEQCECSMQHGRQLDCRDRVDLHPVSHSSHSVYQTLR